MALGDFTSGTDQSGRVEDEVVLRGFSPFEDDFQDSERIFEGGC